MDWKPSSTARPAAQAGAWGGGRVERKMKLTEKMKSREYRDARTEAEVTTSIQTQIRSLRIKRGWTQRELAKRAGTSQTVISRIEQPTDYLVSVRTLVRIANAFDMPISIKFGKWKRYE